MMRMLCVAFVWTLFLLAPQDPLPAPADVVVYLSVDLSPDGMRIRQWTDSETTARMVARFAEHPEWEAERAARWAYEVPEEDAGPDHVTLVLHEGERIEWRCNRPCMVMVDRQPGLTAIENTPFNPFAWDFPMASTARTRWDHRLQQATVQRGASMQRFYKFTAWMGGAVLDPDFIVCCSE